MQVWFIDGPEKIEEKLFIQKYVPKLDKILKDSNASIIITDRPGCANKIARYLSTHGYRNCRVYHTGKNPRHKIGKFPYKGGFKDLTSCKNQLFRDCDLYFCSVLNTT